ncbi:MAG: response regulator [Cellvibrionaceae bacterium]
MNVSKNNSENAAKADRKFSIRFILLAVNASVILLFAIAILALSLNYRQIINEREETSSAYFNNIQKSQTIRYLYQQYEQEWKNILLRGEVSESYHFHLSRFYQIERDMRGEIKTLSETLNQQKDQQPAKILTQFEDGSYQMAKIYRRALTAYNQSFENPEVVARTMADKATYSPMQLSIDLISALEESRRKGYEKTTDKIQRFESELFYAGLFITPFIFVAVYFFLGGLIVKPIENSIEFADSIASGDLNHAMKPTEGGSREAYQLLSALNHMQGNIRAAQADLLSAKEQAESASKAQASFLANMSHEIRTPMNAVIGMAELLKDANLEGEYQDYLNTLQMSGKTLITVINDILDYSKIVSGKLKFEVVSVNLKGLLDSMLLPYRDNKKDVELELIVAEDVPEVIVADTTRMHQILGNLISNAVKFTEKGFIRLSVNCLSIDSDKVVLKFSVADSGVGISPEAQSRIFNQFEQADSSTTRRYGGTGLGLAICSKLVQIAGGEISVKSNLGVGSMFNVVLPFKQGSSVPNTTKEVDVTNASGLTGLKVLVVEDNPVNQKVVSVMLNKLGVEAQVVGNGQEALVVRCRSDFQADLILMDCEMPIMDGYEATRQIRKWELAEDLDRITICALTAHSMSNQIRQCFDVGMDAHLAKPIVFAKLKEYLQSVDVSRSEAV